MARDICDTKPWSNNYSRSLAHFGVQSYCIPGVLSTDGNSEDPHNFPSSPVRWDGWAIELHSHSRIGKVLRRGAARIKLQDPSSANGLLLSWTQSHHLQSSKLNVQERDAGAHGHCDEMSSWRRGCQWSSKVLWLSKVLWKDLTLPRADLAVTLGHESR